jgi:hypothetical protein
MRERDFPDVLYVTADETPHDEPIFTASPDYAQIPEDENGQYVAIYKRAGVKKLKVGKELV